jgi:curli biogenesis system outer membrane secretion channel CsgG
MKKIIIMAAIMLSSVGAFAQHSVGSFTLQPKVGMNIATLTDYSNADSRIGLAVGGEFEYQATDLLGISFGALYSMQGCKDNDATLKLDYINVPILANIYVAKGFAVKLGSSPGSTLIAA